MFRILVVEDDPMLAASLRRALSYEGYEVDTAADGLAALSGARNNPPDLIVLDLTLPIMGRDRSLSEMMHVWTVPDAPQQFGDLDPVWKKSYLDSLSG